VTKNTKGAVNKTTLTIKDTMIKNTMTKDKVKRSVKYR